MCEKGILLATRTGPGRSARTGERARRTPARSAAPDARAAAARAPLRDLTGNRAHSRHTPHARSSARVRCRHALAGIGAPWGSGWPLTYAMIDSATNEGFSSAGACCALGIIKTASQLGKSAWNLCTS